MKTTLTTKLAAAAAATGLALAALTGAATPASAQTTTTFSITSGSLGVTVPTSAAVGSVVSGAGNSVSGQLGAVTVADNRGTLVATWVATVGATNFTTGTGTAPETVANTSIGYGSGAATTTSGTGTFVAGTVATMGTAGTGAAWTVGSGNNSAAWNPTLTFTLLSSQVTGTYTGTVTHSVA